MSALKVHAGGGGRTLPQGVGHRSPVSRHHGRGGGQGRFRRGARARARHRIDVVKRGRIEQDGRGLGQGCIGPPQREWQRVVVHRRRGGDGARRRSLDLAECRGVGQRHGRQVLSRGGVAGLPVTRRVVVVAVVIARPDASDIVGRYREGALGTGRVSFASRIASGHREAVGAAAAIVALHHVLVVPLRIGIDALVVLRVPPSDRRDAEIVRFHHVVLSFRHGGDSVFRKGGQSRDDDDVVVVRGGWMVRCRRQWGASSLESELMEVPFADAIGRCVLGGGFEGSHGLSFFVARMVIMWV
mmetsp:Transcript_23166/g.35291  ORF Transcript_23166/g.35291 Transcript_23166/m.35291 type:complete len:300 (-) Transcript_23166:2-901(-)